MNVIKSVSTWALLLVVTFHKVKADTVTVYDHNHGGGDSISLEVDTCTAFPRGWAYRASSIRLSKKACVELHATRLCTDKRPLVLSNSAEDSNLVDLSGEYDHFNDKALAVKPCSLVTRSILVDKQNGDYDEEDGFLVSLYEFVGKKGRTANLVVGECKNVLPPMYRNVASVDSHGSCVRLYSESSCSGESVQIQPSDALGSTNLHYWNFLDKITSVGPCEEYQQIALSILNKLRQKHHVASLVLSETLNREAESAANILANQIDEPQQTSFTSGALIYATPSTRRVNPNSSASMIQAAINSWYRQHNSYDSRNPVPSAYTQLLSASAKEFGIGIATSPLRVVVVAKYSPTNNFAFGF